jgi:hypothetical protein
LSYYGVLVGNTSDTLTLNGNFGSGWTINGGVAIGGTGTNGSNFSRGLLTNTVNGPIDHPGPARDLQYRLAGHARFFRRIQCWKRQRCQSLSEHIGLQQHRSADVRLRHEHVRPRQAGHRDPGGHGISIDRLQRQSHRRAGNLQIQPTVAATNVYGNFFLAKSNGDHNIGSGIFTNGDPVNLHGRVYADNGTLTFNYTGGTQQDFGAVPEPGTWVLITGGLGLIAWKVRGRRKECDASRE